MKRLLVAILLLYPLSALAQTYEWTDEHGTVNFTEDLGNVPKKYRKKVKVLGGESGEPEVVNEPATEGKPKGEAGEKAEKSKKREKAKMLYGGRDGNYWHKEFAAARREIEATDASLSQLRERLNDTSHMSRGEYLAIHNTINNEEARLKGQQKKLDDLKESADRAGVPMEFRE